MRSRHRFAILCGLALALGAADPAPSAEVGFRIVDTGNTFSGTLGQSGPVARIVRDRQETAALLAEWVEQPLRREPNVDFRRRSLVVVVAGEWPDSGYVILPGSVVVRAGRATFTGTIFRRSGLHLDAFMRPFAIVSVPREAVAEVAPDVAVKLRCAQRVRCQGVL